MKKCDNITRLAVNWLNFDGQQDSHKRFANVDNEDFPDDRALQKILNTEVFYILSPSSSRSNTRPSNLHASNV